MEKKFCPATWFSGFFALGALVHLVRLVFRLPVTIGSFAVPFQLSLLLVLILGGISLVLLAVALKKPCCRKE